MKLCLITEYFPESEKGELRGGVESRCYHIAQELSKKHTVYIITSSEKEDAVREYRIGRIKVISCCKHRYTHEGAFLSRLRFAWRAYRLWPLLEEKGIDLVDGQNFICCVPAYFAARKLHIPTVATYHEVWVGEWIRNKGIGTGMLGEVWERFVLKLSWNKIITVSHFTKDRLLQQGIREKDVAVVHNGVDLKKYKQYKHQRKVGKFSRPTICCISRLTEKKRVEDLLRALLLVKKQIPSIQCKIIGSGKEERALRKVAGKLGIGEQVAFLGYIQDYQKMLEILQRSHVFCLPSVLEGFGIVVVEAMACQVPYVCSDIPPLKEVTEQGKGGLLFAATKHEDLAAKILLLLQDRRLYQKKQQEAKKLVVKYDWGKLAKQVEQAYQEALHA